MKQVAGRLTALFVVLLFGAALACAQTAAAPTPDQPASQAGANGQAPSQAQPQHTPQSPNGAADQGAPANPNAPNPANRANPNADNGAAAPSPATTPDQTAPRNTYGRGMRPWLWIGIGVAAAVAMLFVALSGRGNRDTHVLLDKSDRFGRDRLGDLRRDRDNVADRADRIDRDDIRRAG